MQNITISIPEETLKNSREYAKKHHTSLNAMIRDFLVKTTIKTPSQDWLQECFALMDKTKAHSKGKKWQRQDLYDV